MYRGQREQARNRSRLGIDIAIGKDQQRIAGLDGKRSALAKAVERALEFLFAAIDRYSAGSVSASKSPVRNTAQFLEIPIGQDRMLQLQRVAVLRRLVEDVALVPDVAGERHHQLFANRIDRRIRDLREELLEVVEQRLRLVGKTRQRRVGAHRADRFFAVDRHRRHQRADVFVGVAEGALPLNERLEVGAVHTRRRGQLVESDLVLLHPLAIRLARRQACA